MFSKFSVSIGGGRQWFSFLKISRWDKEGRGGKGVGGGILNKNWPLLGPNEEVGR
jgi:hypothetical protein